MNLTDKVIKNTLYNFLSQFAAFLSPLILTPFIIGKIGEQNFGIYAIILGFTGTLGLMDFSLSTSFVKFISEYYNQKKYKELNEVINTGFCFYFCFSLIVLIAGYIFSIPLLRIINIPEDLFASGITAFRISLFAFFITNVFIIFTSILISLQRMYIVSIISFISTLVNILLIMIFLLLGFGLVGLLWSQFITACILSFVPIYFSFKHLPQMKFGIKYTGTNAFKNMGKFGLQMQLSKLATFASEKYDEILLGIYSSLYNVTYYNIAVKLGKFSRFAPMQVVNQVAPVAAELNAKNEINKLKKLFSDISKYLTLVALPIVIYVFTFADLLIFTWMGTEYPTAVHITRVLIIGQAINLIFSAPGNSITPNIGKPKYQMFEGLIHLGVNLIVSFILIINFGVLGAAYGNAFATVISSLYVFYVSSSYFKTSLSTILSKIYIKPTISVIISSILSFIVFSNIKNTIIINNRINGLYMILITGSIFIFFYILIILLTGFLDNYDKFLIYKTLGKFIPKSIKNKYKQDKTYTYNNELLSFFVVTHNRLEMLKTCITSLLKSIEGLNYELIIWDNNSTDGTKEYLGNLSLTNKKIRVILHDKNAGTNGKAYAAEQCKGDYIFGIDDDVLDFPENWAIEMLTAYNCIPFMGYLATDVVQNEFTNGAKASPELYQKQSYLNGKYNLLIGPTGGWCFLISREVYNEIGKFLILNDRVFFFEDGDYGIRAMGKGLKVGILEGLKVFHATGDYYNKRYRQILQGKYQSIKINLPFKYRLVRKLKTIFSFKKYFRKIIDASIKSS